MRAIEIFASFFLISFSAFLSCTEVAIFSLSRFQLRQMREQLRAAHQRIKDLLRDPGGLLLTILVSNELVNILFSTLVANVVIRAAEQKGSWFYLLLPKYLIVSFPIWFWETIVGIAIATPIILLFGEVTPKVVGTRLNSVIAPIFSVPIVALHWFMSPMRALFRIFFISFGQRPEAQLSERVDEEDLLTMLEQGHREGTIEQAEIDLIRNIFSLDETSASEVFTPIDQVLTVRSTMTLKDAITAVQGREFSRIPVTGKNNREIVGILYKKDLVFSKWSTGHLDDPVVSLMRQPHSVPATTRLNVLFRRLRASKIHLAVVMNEKDEAIGVISMRDILDEIFEELTV